MSAVFVIDQHKKPCDPVHPGRARCLLTAGHAAVYRRYPFTIIMKEAKLDTIPAPLRMKIDPGSQTTGLAVVNDVTGEVVSAAELSHRGQQVKETWIRGARNDGGGGIDIPGIAHHVSRIGHARKGGCHRPWRVASRMSSPGWSGYAALLPLRTSRMSSCALPRNSLSSRI